MKFKHAFALLSVVAVIVYLFATAPPPLGAVGGSQQRISVERALTVVADENSVIRQLYTSEIVGPGMTQGMTFSEHWHDPGNNDGPLPALLLRAMATSLQHQQLPLGLFLGSTFPIAQANLFTGEQREAYLRMGSTGEVEFFFEEDIDRYTLMFPDIASADACVRCHNEHEHSPKRNWQRGDVMGATTWTYPRDQVSQDEVRAMVIAVRAAAREAYEGYLEKAAQLSERPEIGARWPREGLFLPTADVFMTEVRQRASASTLEVFLEERGRED